jgi:hypothetical protein
MNNVIWIVGRKATLAATSHEYIVEPFLAFTSEAEAIRARDMIEKISGEKVKIASAAMMSERQP